MSSGRSGITAAALTALLALAPPAAAQDASTLKKDMVGQWELATTERSKAQDVDVEIAHPDVSPLWLVSLVPFVRHHRVPPPVETGEGRKTSTSSLE